MKLKKTIAAIAAAALTVSAISFAAFADPDVTTEHEHNYTSAITTPATCTTKGVKTFTCQNEEGTCDKQTYTEEIDIDPEAHKEVTISAVPPTCTTAGTTAGTKCELCEKVLTEPEEDPATGHTEAAIGTAVDATCTTVGKTAGKKCSVCGTVIEAQKELAALGHSFDDEGNCTREGCDATKPEDDHEHEYVYATTPATCTAKGSKTGTCTLCGDTTEEELDMIAHTYVDGTCSVCGAEENSDDTDPTPAPAPTPGDVTPPADDNVTPPAADDDLTPPADDDSNAVVDDYASTGVTGASSSGAADAPVVSTPAQISATRNPVLTVDAAETPVSSDMLDAFVKNDDAEILTLSYSSVLKIAIEKDDVNDISAGLDLSVNTEGFLSAKEIKKLDATKVVQIDLEGEGSFDGVDKVTVKYRVGAKLAGKEVTVYEYVNGKLVKIGTGKVTANGFVNFKTDHFGQFVIAVE